MQTQTARSAYLGLASRLPGVTHASITEAYERHALVRGSTIRGTVHTSTPAQHVWLDRATRVGQRTLWARALRLRSATLDQVWDGIEDFASSDWREVDQLGAHLRAWLEEHDEQIPDQLSSSFGRYLSFGHGGLIRRPLSGGWESQGKPGYRAVDATLSVAGVADAARLAQDRSAPHEEAMAAVVLLHLSSHGPATRNDVAWWSGLGLREVDAALVALGERVSSRPGPGGADFWDTTDGGASPVSDVGTWLLPEFDAVLCGYDPKLRDRFVTPEQHAMLWNQQNGLMRSPLLHRGRLVGWWRLEGSGRRRRLQISCFDDVPSEDDLSPSVAALTVALPVELSEVVVGAAH